MQSEGTDSLQRLSLSQHQQSPSNINEWMILIKISEEALKQSWLPFHHAQLLLRAYSPLLPNPTTLLLLLFPHLRLSSRFLGTWVELRIRLEPSNGSRTTCWFKFGKNGVDAENAGIYGSQSRDDFDRDDVEQYFNYMGMLAVEGTYDKIEALLNQIIHPVDILLMLAASEGDKPKIEELLRASADYTVKDNDGRTALDRASSEEIHDLTLGSLTQKA